MFKKMNLFSKTEVKILRFFLEHDGEEYEREISRKTKVSVGAANFILKKFEKLGLILKFKKGRMNFYKRNDENSEIKQYKIILTMEILEPVVKKLKETSSLIILFGSSSKGENVEESDIDLFVLSEEKSKANEIVKENKKINANILNKKEYSELREKDKPLYGRIEKGIELWREKHEY